jgi:hypothetical protein
MEKKSQAPWPRCSPIIRPPAITSWLSRKNILKEHLNDRPEYVETISEFNDIKAKLLAMHNRRANDPMDPSKPHLNGKPGSSGSNNGSAGGSGTSNDSGSSDDDRPTLKRRQDD